MKKSVVVVFFTSVLIFLSFCFSVYAQGADIFYLINVPQDWTLTERCTYYKNPELLLFNRQWFVRFITPIGCPCILESATSGNLEGYSKFPEVIISTFPRSNFSDCLFFCGDDDRKEATYCDTGVNGKTGFIKECTTDTETKYEPIAGYSRPRNSECSFFPVFTPFCEDDICHECIDNSECITMSNLVDKFNGATNAICMKAKLYTPNHKYCSFCKPISGEGKIAITLAGELSEAQAIKIVQELITIQPFKFLYENKTLKFNYAYSDINKYVHLGPSFEVSDFEIRDKIDEICPGTEIEVYFNKAWVTYVPNSYFDSLAGLIVINNDEEWNEDGSNYPGNLHIELAHNIGRYFGLSDEYFVNFRDEKNIGENLDDCNTRCSEFDRFIDEFNCYSIIGINEKTSVFDKEPFCKSTPNSIMNHGNKFDIVGCSVLLERFTWRFERDSSFKLCKQWACEPDEPIIRQSKTVCKN